jgi:putative flippase GtrA
LVARITTFAKTRRIEIVRFLKFCIVGVIGTILDFGLLNLLHNVFGLPLVLSNTVSITAAIVNNYLWSRFWVYPETKDQEGGRKFFRFVMVSIAAWFLNTAILWGTDSWLLGESGLFAPLVAQFARMIGVDHGVLSSNLSKVIATAIVLFWNFFANRYWTFRDVDEVEPAAASSVGQVEV